MKKILILGLCLVLSGCATMSISKIAAHNKGNLSKLSEGMAEEEALNIMGTKKLRSTIWNFYTAVNNPYRSEIIQIKEGRTIKILYYFTGRAQERINPTWETYSITNNDLTPLVFEEGKLIGIGLESLNSILMPQD